MDALDNLLKKIESDLHLIRRDLTGTLNPLREALDAYERAVEEEAVTVYCRDHSLKLPNLRGVSRANAAERVRKAFAQVADFSSALPEQSLPRQHANDQQSTSAQQPTSALPLSPVPSKSINDSEESDSDRAFRIKFKNLTRAAGRGKLLVFGAFAGRTKSLPGPLYSVTEWIDTAQEGNRIVSNAVKRMRLGSIFAVIICDQAIQHQHAEPVVTEARSQNIPVGYAGKGGNGALARALESLETSLG